jgi:hypothetical protein
MTAKEWRIIKEYAEHHELKPQLSTPSIGQFVFLDRYGQSIKVSMQTMKAEVEELRKGDKQS